MNPAIATRTAQNALHDVPPCAGHHDLSGLIANLAGAVRGNLALSIKCRDSVIEQLDELADEVDQDLRNQQAEQSWNEEQTRDAAFGPSPADRLVAAGIAAIRKPLEMTHG
jgi:hypothetical protein